MLYNLFISFKKSAGTLVLDPLIYILEAIFMKKLFAMTAGLAILAAVLFTGCNLLEQLKEEFLLDYDTWYEYNSEVSVPVIGESTSDTGGMLNNARVFIYYNEEDGLKILVCTTKEQTITFEDLQYSVEANVTTGGQKEYSAEEFGPGKWAGLSALGAGCFEEEEPPELTVTLENLLEGNFNLKRLLANLLLGYIAE